jgi:hypothetical protein
VPRADEASRQIAGVTVAGILRIRAGVHTAPRLPRPPTRMQPEVSAPGHFPSLRLDEILGRARKDRDCTVPTRLSGAQSGSATAKAWAASQGGSAVDRV